MSTTMPASAGLFPLESVESPARNSLGRILRTDVNVRAIGFWNRHRSDEESIVGLEDHMVSLFGSGGSDEIRS
jgi:hypothetical protein